MKQLVPVWLRVRVEPCRNLKGLKLARTRAERYTIPLIGWKPIRRVRMDDLREMRARLLESTGRAGRPLSVQTVRHVLADVRNFIRWATKSGYIDHLRDLDGLLPRKPERKPRPFTDEEVAKLAALPDPDGFAIRLAVQTGLRWGELVLLQASDIEDGQIVLETPKTGRVRRVPLPAALLFELRGRVGRLFPFVDTQLSAFVLRVARLSGIAGFGPHRLRHTYGCAWVRAGGSLAALQEILGHRSVTTTQMYAGLNDDAIRCELARLDRGGLFDFLGPNRDQIAVSNRVD